MPPSLRIPFTCTGRLIISQTQLSSCLCLIYHISFLTTPEIQNRGSLPRTLNHVYSVSLEKLKALQFFLIKLGKPWISMTAMTWDIRYFLGALFLLISVAAVAVIATFDGGILLPLMPILELQTLLQILLSELIYSKPLMTWIWWLAPFVLQWDGKLCRATYLWSNCLSLHCRSIEKPFVCPLWPH